MSIRGCIYKNCDNYINLKDREFNDHITLFAFPKNPERRQKWIENGKAPPNLPASMYFYCSDHFDQRYLAVNNRRTILVGEAVPYVFIDGEIEETYNENLDYYLYEMKNDDSSDEVVIEEEQTQEQEVHVESTTCINDEDQNNDILQEEVEWIKETKNHDINNKKRVLNDGINPKPKILKTTTISKEQSPQTNTITKTTAVVKSHATIPQTDNAPAVELNSNEIEINLDSLVDTKYVTTFIFKGEEYVQMPKDHYIKEKIDLVKKLQKMERVVLTIKQQLNNLELE